jgi:hypothetical protein
MTSLHGRGERQGDPEENNEEKRWKLKETEGVWGGGGGRSCMLFWKVHELLGATNVERRAFEGFNPNNMFFGSKLRH